MVAKRYTAFRRSVVAAVLLLLVSGAFAISRHGGFTRAAPLPQGESVFQTGLPVAVWNDNDRAAGRLDGGVLTLGLEVARAEWRYLGADGPSIPILAFRETGGPPTNPGPMIRVPLGTEVDVEIANPLDAPLVVHGLSGRRTTPIDSLVVPAGGTRRTRFVADAEGTWFYWGTTNGEGLDRPNEDSQLHGALIVDPPGGGPEPDERVMLLSLWIGEPDPVGEIDWQMETFAINGRPWPHTERLAYDLGDTVRWRVINATDHTHPMHLHGFFFEVLAKGDLRRQEIFWPVERPMAVTERLDPGETVTLRWVADRPGGWVYHCHNSYHVVPNPTPGQYADGAARDHDLLTGHHGHDPNRHVVEAMGGLMMGLYVRPPPGWNPDDRPRRRLRVFVQSDSTAGERRRYGYVLAGDGHDPPPDSVPWPGSTIVVRQGEPTSVTVINRLEEPTQVHWHGLEIESYYDGVAGVGGHPGSLTPAIMPGDSFEMRITPPRPGSYMYHTHISDIRQQSGGLYGAFVVLGRDVRWDPETDRVLLLSTSNDPGMSLLLNGSREPGPLGLEAGTTYRFRLMNVTLFNGLARVRLLKEGFPVRWRAVARDGADLPPHQRVVGHADRVVSIGETADFEYTPGDPGDLVLEVRSVEGSLLVSQSIRITESPAGDRR